MSNQKLSLSNSINAGFTPVLTNKMKSKFGAKQESPPSSFRTKEDQSYFGYENSIQDKNSKQHMASGVGSLTESNVILKSNEIEHKSSGHTSLDEQLQDEVFLDLMRCIVSPRSKQDIKRRKFER